MSGLLGTSNSSSSISRELRVGQEPWDESSFGIGPTGGLTERDAGLACKILVVGGSFRRRGDL